MKETKEKVRLDKWLWAARFFKTRSRAAQAVNGGKVHLNGSRVKAARAVNVGDDLLVSRGNVEFKVKVMGLSLYRRPAVEAQLLYEEYEESILAREENRDLRRMFNASHSAPAKKPNKRDRRKIKEFVRKN
ncbi:MAG: RNA-binding protein [Desulfobulbaceae bacterium S3730MH12]|nr:MAG: RNA-binding protein [Desulfobulbaceae bacterium S3730MH12]